MDKASKRPAEIDPLITRALSHPKRAAMLGYITHKRGETIDEAELADAFDLSILAMRYHLVVLQHADLIMCVEAGAIERCIAAAMGA